VFGENDVVAVVSAHGQQKRRSRRFAPPQRSPADLGAMIAVLVTGGMGVRSPFVVGIAGARQ
jgi:hypothetical protein